MEKKLAVIALGGNALLRGNQKGTIEEQNANTIDTLENLVYLIKEGYNLIISHGNGPQVGNVLMLQELKNMTTRRCHWMFVWLSRKGKLGT